MEPLIRIGYWWSEREPFLPHPERFVDDDLDADGRDLVVDYLHGGLVTTYWMGYSTCRICGLERNGTSDLSDGTYLWPEGLAHYVEAHNVRLPNEFVEHATSRFRSITHAAAAANNGDFDDWLRMTK